MSPRATSKRGSPCTARSLSRSRSMSPSPNTSGSAGSSGNPLNLASDAATVLHPYRQNRRREVLITNANLRGRPNAVEATPGRTTGPFLARRGGPSTGGWPSGAAVPAAWRGSPPCGGPRRGSADYSPSGAATQRYVRNRLLSRKCATCAGNDVDDRVEAEPTAFDENQIAD